MPHCCWLGPSRRAHHHQRWARGTVRRSSLATRMDGWMTEWMARILVRYWVCWKSPPQFRLADWVHIQPSPPPRSTPPPPLQGGWWWLVVYWTCIGKAGKSSTASARIRFFIIPIIVGTTNYCPGLHPSSPPSLLAHPSFHTAPFLALEQHILLVHRSFLRLLMAGFVIVNNMDERSF